MKFCNTKVKLNIVRSIALLLLISLIFPGYIWAGAKKDSPTVKVKIAVMDLEPQDVKETLTTTLTNILRDTIFKTGKYEMLTRDDMESILKNAAARALLDPECDTDKCIADIAGALGVERMVAGSIGKVGNTFLISFRLVDTSKGKTINTHVERVKGSEEELIEGVVKGANILVLYANNQKKAEKPVITHTPVDTLSAGNPLKVDAVVSDSGKMASVKIFYREAGTRSYTSTLMTDEGNNFYRGAVPEKSVSIHGMEYYVEAVDSDGNVARSATVGAPHQVSVLEKRKKSSTWKWVLGIAGAVLLGGAAAALGGGGGDSPGNDTNGGGSAPTQTEGTVNIEW